MTLHARTLAAILAFAALPLANAADASSAPANKLSPADLQRLRDTVVGRPLLVAVPAPAQIGPDQSWIYREDTDSNGQHIATRRGEATTAFQNRHRQWLVAVRPLGETLAEPVRFAVLVDGCLTDVLGDRLQASPCQLPQPGQAWTLPPDATGLRREFKAIARENVDVPAGRFEALRVEESDFTPLALPDGTRSELQNARVVWWYVDKLSAMARVERELVGADGKATGHVVRVLESSGPATEDAKAAVRAAPQWAANERAKAAHARIAALQRAMPTLSQPALVQATSPECRPTYPPAAIRARATGQTQVALLVDADGSIQASEVVTESGPTREHLLLDNTVLAALSKCPAKPALDAGGHPTASIVQMAYTWKLD